ncbi:hypothetical protein PTSG_00808 [Salpingoeca rosetta]|uniref:EF-hand domain-containing protein n=1 Tax=Salpingoeca rosetta (strain ATCC 50818 / BSB-021) TaxID=946362 RepID=F2TXJ3_SALR5|nr:uncharacterized protein PTSG_00808 [Salpingoeca rosetta]EGD76102.1 hypothetical protein PTSG_00808 [Salpingoeca rosetta]|eukprot:XP_004998277.1 hypothetical protein PTSG_00808 [Salpingoeca rosetta]
MSGVPKFTDKQLKEFRMAFDTFDKDADGKVDSDSCCRAMRACGIPLTVKEVQEITTDLDLYSDSEINWDGFLALLEQHWKPIPTKEELVKAFQRIDTDGSGSLSATELKRYLTNIGDPLSEDEFKELLKDVDQDGDGEVSFKEFVDLMTSGVTYKDY